MWNQFQGDAANTGQNLGGSKPATSSDFTRFRIGSVFASPVFGPDGNLYISSYSADGSALGNAILRVAPNPMKILASAHIGAQLSTPAVDAAGNIFVAQYSAPNGPSKLIALNSDLKQIWSIPVVGEALSPPKILVRSDGTELVIQEYIGGTEFGDHILVANTAGTVLGDQVQCLVLNGGSSIQFQIPGVRIGPPYSQRSALAVREFDAGLGPQVYVVLAAGQCGIVLLRLDFMNGLHFVPLNGYLNDSEFFGNPLISSDGIAVVPIDGKSVTAFRLGTGAKMWTYKTSAYLGALFPTGGISAYILSETVDNTGIGASSVLKLDVATGQFDTYRAFPATLRHRRSA